MSKRTPVLFAVFALLLATVAVAEKPTLRLSHEAFLQSLELPAGGSLSAELPFAPSPAGKIQTKACTYTCKSCSATKVKLCFHCVFAFGVVSDGCDPCVTGTTCSS